MTIGTRFTARLFVLYFHQHSGFVPQIQSRAGLQGTVESNSWLPTIPCSPRAAPAAESGFTTVAYYFAFVKGQEVARSPTNRCDAQKGFVLFAARRLFGATLSLLRREAPWSAAA